MGSTSKISSARALPRASRPPAVTTWPRRRTTRAARWWSSVPELRVCALYPDLMNIYADRGNLLVLERRCGWRGISFSLQASGLGEPLDPDGADLYYIGGG